MSYKVVAISSCACGIAHTYMNAEAMLKQAQAHGIDLHVEKQGSLGIEDEVSEDEFADADAIVLCCGVAPEGEERFDQYKDKIVELNFDEVLKNPNLFIDELRNFGLKIN